MYCSIEDVTELLPEGIIPQGGNPAPNPRNPKPETITNTDVQNFIEMAEERVHARLGSMYYVPFHKVNMGGTISFPAPIPFITATFAAMMIFQRRVQGADRQNSEALENQLKMAEEYMASIQNGEMELTGQRAKGSRVVRQTAWDIPRNPAEGGRTKGSG